MRICSPNWYPTKPQGLTTANWTALIPQDVAPEEEVEHVRPSQEL